MKPSQSPRRQKQNETPKGKGKSKGGKQKSKDVGEKGKGQEEVSPAAFKTLVPPAPPQVANPFAAPSTGSTLSAPSSSSTEVQMMIQAIKQSYPDAGQIPVALQQWTAKMGESEDKDRTRNLHKETTRLGQAQKLLRETRAGAASYEPQWKEHVVKALSLLKEQKEAFLAQRSQLADMERKAIIELNGARRAIAKLNKAEEKVIQVEEDDHKDEMEETSLMDTSVEDTSLREFIEQYAESVGLVVSVAPPTAEEDPAHKGGKRPREAQVFHEGSAQPVAAQPK